MNDLPEVLNWRRIDNNTSLSGQPDETQLAKIKELGVTRIINLGPHSNKGALADEAGTVAELGLTYVYIPVDFENPTDDDFDTFCQALLEAKGQKIHVHCIYNARVSSFFYRYAQGENDIAEQDAFTLMDGIWRPGGVWARFIGHHEQIDQPNRYAGDDY